MRSDDSCAPRTLLARQALANVACPSYIAEEPVRRVMSRSPTELYTKIKARCDKLATVVGRTKLTTLATIDVPRRNLSKSRVWGKISEQSTLIFEHIM